MSFFCTTLNKPTPAIQKTKSGSRRFLLSGRKKSKALWEKQAIAEQQAIIRQLLQFHTGHTTMKPIAQEKSWPRAADIELGGQEPALAALSAELSNLSKASGAAQFGRARQQGSTSAQANATQAPGRVRWEQQPRSAAAAAAASGDGAQKEPPSRFQRDKTAGPEAAALAAPEIHSEAHSEAWPVASEAFKAAWDAQNASGEFPSAWGAWKTARFLRDAGALDAFVEQDPQTRQETEERQKARMRKHWAVAWMFETPCDEQDKLLELAFGGASLDEWRDAVVEKGGKIALKGARSIKRQLMPLEAAGSNEEIADELREAIVETGDRARRWGQKMALAAKGLSAEKQTELKTKAEGWFPGTWQERLECELVKMGVAEAILSGSESFAHVLRPWLDECENRMRAAFFAALNAPDAPAPDLEAKAFEASGKEGPAMPATLAVVRELLCAPNLRAAKMAEAAGAPFREPNWPQSALSGDAVSALKNKALEIESQARALGFLRPAADSGALKPVMEPKLAAGLGGERIIHGPRAQGAPSAIGALIAAEKTRTAEQAPEWEAVRATAQRALSQIEKAKRAAAGEGANASETAEAAGDKG